MRQHNSRTMRGNRNRQVLRTIVVSLALVGTAAVCAAAPPSSLPGDFVFLRDIDPTILQDIRYATANNFTGSPLPGYESAECVLLKPTAEALKRVQQDLVSRKLSLKVFDCYRPTRAVDAMVHWANDEVSSDATRHYHPRVVKNALLPRGYIASRSDHSLGTTVDLTIVDLAATRPADSTPLPRAPCIAPAEQRGTADGVDMGTSFDCFDVRSRTDSPEINAEQKRWRAQLRQVMDRQAFSNYAREWWHYTRYRARGTVYFDFPIPKR